MKRVKLALTGIVTLLLTTFGIAAQDGGGDERYEQQKVVYHINHDGGEDGRSYRAAMNNIQNHISAVGAQNLEARVVLHGDGVGLLSEAIEDDRLQTQIGSLKAQDVAFVICNNTLESRDIVLDDLYDAWEDDVVPSGVAELSHLQQQGFTYIKP
ncbi:DsrE family protein [Roseitranquillus sediminis]|uniref:DsrE family protein n=1 Tax=Roseitranquillus sediminis TaxID=2809051 RepID=UPI001D0CA4CA|nr:DsrE family protein [Roseitranquillus sediminis]MBM9595850.1 DsrE family protein [Roseitranquillus sediminis]